MAKAKEKQSVMGYFRNVFLENPRWLKIRSNEAVFARYRADMGMSPDEDIPQNIKQSLANAKTTLKRPKKGKRKKLKYTESSSTQGVLASGKTVKPASKRSLDRLEEIIDNVLLYARGMEREDLAEVTSLLRRARNAVVLMSN